MLSHDNDVMYMRYDAVLQCASFMRMRLSNANSNTPSRKHPKQYLKLLNHLVLDVHTDTGRARSSDQLSRARHIPSFPPKAGKSERDMPSQSHDEDLNAPHQYK